MFLDNINSMFNKIQVYIYIFNNIIFNIIDVAFNNVEKYAKFLNPFIKIYEENTTIDINTFEKKENEQFKISINKYN